MLAGLGTIVMAAGMYVFLAIRAPFSFVCMLLGVGILLVVGQFLRLGKGVEHVTAVTGDIRGR
jgi:hypothetical protein